MSNVHVYRSVAHLNGMDLFHLDTRAEGPAILCLHGRWGRAETWFDFMQRYGDRYRVIAPDQRGHGLSGKPISRYTAEEMSADATALLDLLGIGSAIVVGHSMGGHVAGYLAAMNPGRVRALAILDKSANGPERPRSTPLEELEIDDPVTRDWPIPFGSRAEAQEYIKRAMESELSYQYFMNSLAESVNGYGMLFSEQAMTANIAYYSQWFDLLPRIECPVMLVRAKGGEAVPDEDFGKMRELIPDCMAFEMSDPDHNVHLADRGEFYRYFDEFLSAAGLTIASM